MYVFGSACCVGVYVVAHPVSYLSLSSLSLAHIYRISLAAMKTNVEKNVNLEELEAATGTKALVTGHTWATDPCPLLDALKTSTTEGKFPHFILL